MIRLADVQKNYETMAGPITVCGWVRTVRDGKNLGFIELADGTCFKTVQIVYEKNGKELG